VAKLSINCLLPWVMYVNAMAACCYFVQEGKGPGQGQGGSTGPRAQYSALDPPRAWCLGWGEPVRPTARQWRQLGWRRWRRTAARPGHARLGRGFRSSSWGAVLLAPRSPWCADRWRWRTSSSIEDLAAIEKKRLHKQWTSTDSQK
jgi:hypothetical protein